MSIESISQTTGLAHATQNAPGVAGLSTGNALSPEGPGLQPGGGKAVSIGELAGRVEQLGPGSVSPEVHDALMRAGVVNPDSGNAVAPAAGVTPETGVGSQAVQTDPGKLHIEETPSEVRVLDSEGNVVATMSPEEYAILKKAGLTAQMVNGRVCFVRNDIDPNYTDAMGRTNVQRMAQGLAPLDSATGQPIELHHVGQKEDGALAELTMEEHRVEPNNMVLHPNRNGSEVDHGNEWNQQKTSHWKTRAENMGVTA